MSTNDNDQLQTLDKGIDILMRLIHHDAAAGVQELSAASGINKSTTFRILRTLQRRGLVTQVSDGKYEIRVESFHLIMSALSSKISLQRVARSELENLASEMNETVTLSAVLDSQAQCLDKVDSKAAVHITHLLGRLSPLHAGASGKAILAFMGTDRQQTYLKKDHLDVFTDKTMVDREKLTEELEAIRRRGYAISHGELDKGVSAVSAPLFDSTGTVQGSITILGFSEDFTEDKTTIFGEAVMKAASAVSSSLGYKTY